LKGLYWLPGLAPMALFAFFIIQNKVEDMSFPTTLNVYQNTVIVHGLVETVRERPVDEVLESIYTNKTYFLNKETGTELFRLEGLEPLYAISNKVMMAGAGYQIIDLTSGNVEDVLTEGEIKSRAEELGEKIFSVNFDYGNNALSMRTVKDKTFYYDPIERKENPTESQGLMKAGKASFPIYKSKTSSLFQPQLVGTTQSGIAIVLSYQDLNKEYFILNGFNADGDLLWTKHDTEISSKLKGHNFSHEGRTTITATDEKNFYFANRSHIVCISAETGKTIWVGEI
jgi:outer membrane protein assembly factor BamB